MVYNILSLQGALENHENAIDTLRHPLNARGDDLNVTKASIADLSQICTLAKKAHAIFCDSNLKAHPLLLSVCESLNFHTRLTHIKNSRTDVVVASEAYGALDKNDSGFTNNSTFGREAYDTIRYSELQIERTARIAFEIAQTRNKSLCLSDMATYLLSSKLWHKIIADINEDYPNVFVSSLDFEDALQSTLQNPSALDVLLSPRPLADVHVSILTKQDDTVSSTCYVGDTPTGIYCLSSSDSENLLATTFCLRHSFDLYEQA